MVSLMFLCPKMLIYAHGWTDEETDDPDTYESLTCSACGATHLVNAVTGRVLGSDEDNRSQE